MDYLLLTSSRRLTMKGSFTLCIVREPIKFDNVLPLNRGVKQECGGRNTGGYFRVLCVNISKTVRDYIWFAITPWCRSCIMLGSITYGNFIHGLPGYPCHYTRFPYYFGMFLALICCRFPGHARTARPTSIARLAPAFASVRLSCSFTITDFSQT